MKTIILGIFLLVLLTSPCAADSITLNAGDSFRWNLTQADYVKYTWPSSSVREAIVGQNVLITYYDFRVSIFDHATDLVPFATYEFRGPSMMGYGWGFLTDPGRAMIFDGDMSLLVTVLSGSGIFNAPTVEIINSIGPGEEGAGGPGTVPLPPPIWLFGSGLLGLAGWRRFRKG
jgi:hypothetical protein